MPSHAVGLAKGLADDPVHVERSRGPIDRQTPRKDAAVEVDVHGFVVHLVDDPCRTFAAVQDHPIV